MEDKFLSSKSILSRMPLCSYFVSSKIYLFTCKKIAFMSSTEMIIPFRIIFLRLRHEKNIFCLVNFCDVGILRKKMRLLFSRSQCFNRFFLTKSKKGDTIYMRIICLSYREIYLVKTFTPCRRLCGVMNFSVY